MKRSLLTIIALMIIVFIGLSLLGTKDDYVLEKKMWKINRAFDELAKDPQSVPTVAFVDISKKYDRLAERYSDSRLRPVVQLLSARALMFAKSYPEAREVLESIISEGEEGSLVGAQSLAEIGRTYALEEDEVNLLKNYERMIKQFPLTSIGMSTPLYMAKYYADNGMFAKAERAYNDAIRHYESIVSQNPGTLEALSAQKLVATCYSAKKDWRMAVGAFKKILLDFPPELLTPQNMAQVVKSINTISVVELKSFDIPIDIYNEFVAKNPGHPLNKYLSKIVKGFETLKEKNVGVKIK